MFCYSIINLGNHFFLPIKSELIDGFWRSRCLNNHIDLSNMIGIFASGATASLVGKIGTKNLFFKHWYFRSQFCAIYRQKLTIGLLCFFIEWCLTIMHKKIQVNPIKIEGVASIFAKTFCSSNIFVRSVVFQK